MSKTKKVPLKKKRATTAKRMFKPDKIVPPNPAWVQRQLHGWWKEAVNQGDSRPIDPSRNNYLHPSALPFCPLKIAYRRLVDGVESERFESFNENFYVNIGSSVHELLQDFIGRMKVEQGVETAVETLGHWKCPDCGRRRLFTTYKRCKCGGKPKYEEIAIHWRNTIGHMDKVIRIGDYLFILDYKTTGSRALYKHRQGEPIGQPYLPYNTNKAQIMRYVGLFERVFAKEFEPGGRFEGCVVVGALLVYVSRETVRDKAFVYLPANEKKKAREYKKAVRDDKLFAKMKEAVATRDKEIMVHLIENKACETRDDYDENMHSPFDECELSSSCFCPKALRKKVKAALKLPKPQDSDD